VKKAVKMCAFFTKAVLILTKKRMFFQFFNKISNPGVWSRASRITFGPMSPDIATRRLVKSRQSG
jgi:hypothetical protein